MSVTTSKTPQNSLDNSVLKSMDDPSLIKQITAIKTKYKGRLVWQELGLSESNLNAAKERWETILKHFSTATERQAEIMMEIALSRDNKYILSNNRLNWKAIFNTAFEQCVAETLKKASNGQTKRKLEEIPHNQKSKKPKKSKEITPLNAEKPAEEKDWIEEYKQAKPAELPAEAALQSIYQTAVYLLRANSNSQKTSKPQSPLHKEIAQHVELKTETLGTSNVSANSVRLSSSHNPQVFQIKPPTIFPSSSTSEKSSDKFNSRTKKKATQLQNATKIEAKDFKEAKEFKYELVELPQTSEPLGVKKIIKILTIWPNIEEADWIDEYKQAKPVELSGDAALQSTSTAATNLTELTPSTSSSPSKQAIPLSSSLNSQAIQIKPSFPSLPTTDPSKSASFEFNTDIFFA